MQNQYIQDIIKAIKISNPDATNMQLDRNTKFSDVPGMDSMSIVNFQMDLRAIVGEKAEQVQPLPEMSIGELAQILESI